MAAPLSSKERVSQLVHGERRGEKGGVAGDPRSHSDNSKNPQNVVLASWRLSPQRQQTAAQKNRSTPKRSEVRDGAFEPLRQ